MKDIFFHKSLVVVLALLQPAPELADLLAVLLLVPESDVLGHRRRGIAELFEKLPVAELHLSHFCFLRSGGREGGQRSKRQLFHSIGPSPTT